MGIRRFLPTFLVLTLLLLCGCSNWGKGPEISFAEADFSGVNSIVLTNLHTGGKTYIEDAESVEEICDFLRNTKGINGTSAKGYYEGSYAAALYASETASLASLEAETPIFSIAFGDSSSFYYGEFEDGTPARYTLMSNMIEEVTSFFKQYDQHAAS